MNSHALFLLILSCLYSTVYVLCGVISPDVTSETNSLCEDDWHLFENHCYTLQTDRLTWMEASTRCSTMGGNLASIHSEKENDFLLSYMVWNSVTSAWIGLNDRRSESVYEWQDGSSFNYHKLGWTSMRVNYGHFYKDCVEIYYEGRRTSRRFKDRGKWINSICSFERPFICRKALPENVSASEVTEGIVFPPTLSLNVYTEVKDNNPGGIPNAILVGVYLSVFFWLISFAAFTYHMRKPIKERSQDLVRVLFRSSKLNLKRTNNISTVNILQD